MSQDYSPGQFFHGQRAHFPLLTHMVNELKPDGHGVEFGVAEGTSLRIIAGHMPATGFDSFEGLPEQWCGYAQGSRACPVPTVENAELVIGLFADTLPGFDFGAVAPVGLVHFDADLYSSTKTALDHIGPYLGRGCYIVFDEWRNYPGVEEHEPRAWREFVERTGVEWTVVGSDTDAWAIRLTSGVA